MNNESDQRHESPDGTLRITGDTIWEDRIGERDIVHITDPRSGTLLAELWGIRLEGPPTWNPGGDADFSVSVEGAKCRVRIFPDQTFVLHPTEDPRPLGEMSAALWARSPRSLTPPSPAPADTLGWGTILSSLAFAGIGVAGMLYPRPGRRDFWWGALSVVFFGAIALLGIWEKRRRK